MNKTIESDKKRDQGIGLNGTVKKEIVAVFIDETHHESGT